MLTDPRMNCTWSVHVVGSDSAMKRSEAQTQTSLETMIPSVSSQTQGHAVRDSTNVECPDLGNPQIAMGWREGNVAECPFGVMKMFPKLTEVVAAPLRIS